MERKGVLYINPGSAGPRRFQLPVTVARLNLNSTAYAVEFVELKFTIKTGDISESAVRA